MDDLGPSWTTLITKYIKNEHCSQFIVCKGGTHALDSMCHPPQVSWWISHAWCGTPDIEDPCQFGVKWWTWWCSLQPKWRSITAPAQDGKYTPNCIKGEDWNLLCKPGQNGLLSIIVTLMWWGLADKGQGW
ncbi:hypothetical protein BKA83DRAFT_4047087 [Pisolithus microcarpus]|nr:hypothetical protein BKA83DRAFT_4047087 [Pisolithus microcarpus]